jgi:O-antigen ligase
VPNARILKVAQVLIWVLAISAGLREFWLQATALIAALWVVFAWSRGALDATRKDALRPLRWCAWGFVCFFLLHLIRLDTFAALPRLDGPSRALLFAPLLALPVLADMPWLTLRKALVLTGLAIGVGSLAKLGLEPQIDRNFGFFTYFNLLGYAAMTVFGVLACTTSRGPWRWWSMASMASCLWATAASGTRGALLALPVIVVMVLLQDRTALRLGVRRWLTIAVLGLALIWTLAPKFQERLQGVREEIELATRDNNYESSPGQRLAMWTVSLAMIQDRPWFGQGLDVFPSQMQPWAERLGLNVQFEHGGYQNPHNLYLGWAASMGIPTALLLLTLIGVVPWWTSRRMSRGHAADSPSVQAHRALTVLLTLLAVYSLTESVIERQRGMAWFVVWICMILGTQAVSSSHDHRSG